MMSRHARQFTGCSLQSGLFDVFEDLGTEHQIEAAIAIRQLSGIALHALDTRVVDERALQVQRRDREPTVCQLPCDEPAAGTNVEHGAGCGRDQTHQITHTLSFNGSLVGDLQALIHVRAATWELPAMIRAAGSADASRFQGMGNPGVPGAVTTSNHQQAAAAAAQC
jgi:hypothetical protein